MHETSGVRRHRALDSVNVGPQDMLDHLFSVDA
jgi:hypothetical protein